MLHRRLLCSAFNRGSAIRYHNFGRVESVLKLEDVQDPPSPTGNKVLVQMKVSTINRMDHTTINGYFGRPSFPAVVGIEGVGKVVAVGPNVKNLKVNAWVVPRTFEGTFSSSVLGSEDMFTEVNKDVGKDNAALLSHTAAIAYRLVSDFTSHLKPGDVIIQNAGHESVGNALSQIAAAKGLKVISVVPYGTSIKTIEKLKSLGSMIVIDDEYIRTPEYFELVSDLPAPEVAFDGMGGKGGTDLARVVRDQGRMVCYDCMSKEAATFPPSLLLHRNVAIHGFSLKNWINAHTQQEHAKMIDEVANLVISKKLVLYGESYPLKGWQMAFKRSFETDRDGKVMIDFSQ